jgi:membrane protein YqaA with SNARE-associated domain
MKKESPTRVSASSRTQLEAENDKNNKEFLLDDPDISSVEKTKAPLYISLAIVLGLMAAYFLIPGVQDFFQNAWSVLTSDDEQQIKSWVGQFGWIGPLVIARFIEDYGFWAVIVTRLAPFLSNDAISFVAGMLRMGYWRFIGATLLGITPLTIFVAWLGEDNDRLKSGLIWASVISIVGFVAYVWWDRRRKKQKVHQN